MITEQKYVDLNDLDQPIKTLYTNDIYYSFGNDPQSKNFHYSIEKNEVSLDDHIWNSILEPPKIKFNSLRLAKTTSIQASDFNQEVQVFFNLGDRINQYGRRVLNMFEVTGLIGGIYEVLDIVIGTLIGFIYSYAFKVELK